MKIKVLTYNIHKGFDWNNKNYYIQNIKKCIQDLNVDLAFLQEVVGENRKYRDKGLIDAQFEYLADSIWPHYSYGKNSILEYGHHGNLILSQYPILKWERIDVSTNPFEKRGLLVTEINVNSTIVYLICVHFNLLSGGRDLQYKKVLKYIEELNLSPNAPIIIAGDFNDWNKKASFFFEGLLKMTEVHKKCHKVYAKTFPAMKPFLSLDRIYVKNIKIIESFVFTESSQVYLSDHLPLYCEIELNG